jgi:predicted enzyme involved in methoxymalonyl-ACP biosynthesis
MQMKNLTLSLSFSWYVLSFSERVTKIQYVCNIFVLHITRWFKKSVYRVADKAKKILFVLKIWRL